MVYGVDLSESSGIEDHEIKDKIQAHLREREQETFHRVFPLQIIRRR
jgi:hypothetical protein